MWVFVAAPATSCCLQATQNGNYFTPGHELNASDPCYILKELGECCPTLFQGLF